jgi:hypothetical protein
MAKKSQVYDEVISRIMVELDAEQAEYQKLYYNCNGRTDIMAKFQHQRMIKLCEKIRKEIMLAERK